MLHSVKVSDEPQRGAGVVKSWLTNAMYESLLIRYFNTAADENPDDVKVIKVAPTGKVVYNINGNTFILSFKYQQIEGKNTALLIVID